MTGLLLLATLATSQQLDTIKIGLVAAQTGALVPWGTDSITGAQLAVDKVNRAGGLLGKQIELLVADSASMPERAVSATESLLASGAVAILGEVASGLTQPMVAITNKRGVPQVAIGATKPHITSLGDNVFRVCYTDTLQADAMAFYAISRLSLQKVAVMTDVKQPYSHELSTTFIKRFEALGGKVVAQVSYESMQVDFSQELTDVLRAGPDGVFFSGFFNEVGPIVRQAAQIGIKNVKYFGGDGLESRELISTGGEAVIGTVFCVGFSPKDERPEVREFVAAFRKKTGQETPGTSMSGLGHDAAALLLDAIRRAGSTDGKKVIEALRETEGFKGVTSAFTFKGVGQDPARSLTIVRVTKNGFEPIDTIHYGEVYGSSSSFKLGAFRKNTK